VTARSSTDNPTASQPRSTGTPRTGWQAGSSSLGVAVLDEVLPRGERVQVRPATFFSRDLRWCALEHLIEPADWLATRRLWSILAHTHTELGTFSDLVTIGAKYFPPATPDRDGECGVRDQRAGNRGTTLAIKHAGQGAEAKAASVQAPNATPRKSNRLGASESNSERYPAGCSREVRAGSTRRTAH